MTLAERIAARYKAARALNLSLFEGDTYLVVEIDSAMFNGFDRGYVTKTEIERSKAHLEESIGRRELELERYKKYLTDETSKTYQTLLDNAAYAKTTPERWVSDYESKIRRAERASSIRDLTDLFAPMYGSAMYGSTPLLLGESGIRTAHSRMMTVKYLVTQGTANEILQFVATGAKLEDKPNLGDSAKETIQATKWLAKKRRDVITKAMDAMGKDLDAARVDADKKFPLADVTERDRNVMAYERTWRKI